MTTKTIINCMDHTVPANDKGISIIIDPQSQYNGTINSKIIKIQHSNEQQEKHHNTTPTTTTTTTTATKTLMILNNNYKQNGKTLIDIKSNNDHNGDDHKVKHQHQHILQIDCSVTASSEISPSEKEKLENSNVKLESNNEHLTERRGNDDDDDHHHHEDISGNKEHLNLENVEEQIGDVTTKTEQQLNSFAVEEDKEESGQTASQQQQQQQQQQQKQQQREKEEHYEADHQSCFEQVENNGDNGNSKTRENGQKHLTTNEPKQKLKHDDDDNQSGQDVNEGKYDNEHNHNESQDHNEVNNRKENSDNDRNHNEQNYISSGSGIGIGSSSSKVGLVKREVIDFSHAKRSLYDENSNSLLTKADASTATTTTTSSKTLLTISANPKIDKNLNVKPNFEENSSEKINHVVKIQIKPNNSNTLTEKQITVVKIENLEKETISGASEKPSEKQTTPVILKETNEEKMVQKPSSNNAASATTVTVMNGNNHVSNSTSNGNTNANGNGALTGSSTTVTELNVSNPQYLYYMMSSGQFSPCDTLDSGTGSDLESNGQLNQESNKKTSCSSSTSSTTSNNSMTPLEMHLKTTKVRINNTKNNNSLDLQQRQCSFTDSEESEASSLSCDSLHSSEFLRQSSASPIQSAHLKTSHNSSNNSEKIKSLLPDSLLREIKNLKFSSTDYEAENEEEDDLKDNTEDTQDYIKSHEFMQSRKNLNNLPLNISSSLKRASLPSKTFVLNTEDGTFIDTKMNSMPRTYEADKYYNFHVNEHDNFRSFGMNGAAANGGGDSLSISDYETRSLQDDVFAGYRDLRCGSNTSTIRSSKGTVRGVKNRVRNGIATFLQLQQPNIKNYKEKDSGKVVLYTTSMGIIRDTYAKCSNVKKILRTLLVKFEERDVFMSVEYQQEIKERMHSDVIKVPQLYVEGQHIGDADTVERLNETGELRQLLKPYKSISTTYTCQTCGGYRLLPCPSCNGSKKSVHRNHFTAEFVALKCMNCDEVGLVKCHNC